MRFAIVESGGKQYRAVEGSTIEVDRLPVEPGKEFDIKSVLLVADGEEFLIGTPIVSEMLVKATVVDHIKGPKLVSFKYRPKKRIRVKSGHRQQYTRLMIDFIGRPGDERKVEKPAEKTVEAPVEAAEVEKESKAAKQTKGPKEEAVKSSAKKTEKAPATSSPKGKKATTSKSKTSSKSKADKK